MSDTTREQETATQEAPAAADLKGPNIQTNEQYLQHFCKSFGIGWLDNMEWQRVVHMRARPCPSCKERPMLYGNTYTDNALQLNGANRHRTYITAAAVMCHCGRSSYYYDIRAWIDTPRGSDFRKLQDPGLLIASLCDSWNK